MLQQKQECVWQYPVLLSVWSYRRRDSRKAWWDTRWDIWGWRNILRTWSWCGEVDWLGNRQKRTWPVCSCFWGDVKLPDLFIEDRKNLFEPNRTNNTSPLHRVIDVWTIFITVYFIVLLCVKTFPSIREALTFDQYNSETEQSTTAKNQQIRFFLSFSEKCCISWFTLEYIIRAFSAFNKTTYLISAQGIFDLLSFLPYIIQIILQESISDTETIVLKRILVFLMFLSVFKLTRYSVGLQILLKTIQTSVKELTLLLVCVVISLVLFSSVVYYCEISDQSTGFTSIPETFWFIIVTMTTVGYGDMTPTTVAGKLFSALCAVFGVCCVLAIPSTIIVSNFNFFYLRQKGKPRKPRPPKNRMTGLQKWVTRFRSITLWLCILIG